MEEILKSYWAGFVDGEGSISISRKMKIPPSEKKSRNRQVPYYEAVFQLANTDLNIINKFIYDFGFKKKTPTLVNKAKLKKDNSKPLWGVRFSGRQLEKILKILKPYIMIKKEQIKVALEFQETVRHRTDSHFPNKFIPEEILKKREELYQKIRKLNKRGRK